MGLLRYALLLLGACGGEPLRNFVDGGVTQVDAVFPTQWDAPDAAPCTTIMTEGPDATFIDATMGMPAPSTGGTISDARYKLVSATRYADNFDDVRYMIVFTGNRFERAQLEAGETVESKSSGTWSVNGTELLLQQECGNAFQTEHYGYSVGSGTLEMVKASPTQAVVLAFDEVP